MFEINIGKLVGDITYLTVLLRTAEDNSELTQEVRKIYMECCLNLLEAVSHLDIKASHRALDRLIGNLETNEDFTRESFGHFANDFLLRLRDELDLTKFLTLDTNKSHFYEQKTPLFGDAVAKLYPTAYPDIEDAGKCLALGRATACVFHLMRTMEVGIRAVAGALGVPDPTRAAERNWGFILREIKSAIDARKRWRNKEKLFYEEAYASLDAIRNPWRNATMHVEKTYTPEEAENILYAVRFFMTKIASRIDEKGRPASKSQPS
jgi:hypothetical protein